MIMYKPVQQLLLLASPIFIDAFQDGLGSKVRSDSWLKFIAGGQSFILVWSSISNIFITCVTGVKLPAALYKVLGYSPTTTEVKNKTGLIVFCLSEVLPITQLDSRCHQFL